MLFSTCLNYFCTRLGPKFSQYVTFSDKYPHTYIYKIIYINIMYTFEEKNTPSRYLGVESRWDPVFILGSPFFQTTNGVPGLCFNP